MRLAVRFILVACLAISSFIFLQPDAAEAGPKLPNFVYFTEVTFQCSNSVNYAGEWDVNFYEDFYVRVWDLDTQVVLDDEYFAMVNPTGIFGGTFNLGNPLPATVVVDLFLLQPNLQNYNAEAEKSVGLAEVYAPEANISQAWGGISPPLPPGNWIFVESQIIQTTDCASVVGCELAFPIYGTALVLDQQLGYSEPNGEPARDVEGNLIWVLHDLDQDGADTYLIVDIQTGADGETWLGIFIGSCNPVYVPLNQVYPLNSIPVD